MTHRTWLCCLLSLASCATPQAPRISWEAQQAYRQGIRLEAAGEAEKARQRLEAAVTRNPEYPDAQLALLRVLLATSGQTQAQRHAQQVADNPATQPEGLLLLAMLASTPEQKIPLLRRACRTRPSLYQAAYQLGLAQRAAGRFPSALASFEQVLEHRPRHVAAHEQASYCQFRLFRWRLALYHAHQALASDPRAIRPRVFLTVDRLIKRDYEGAIRHIRTLRKHHPNHPLTPEQSNTFLLAYKGSLNRLRITGKIDSGLALAKETVRAFPRASLAHDFLGYFEERSGRHARALRHYERSVALDPYRLGSVQDLRRALIRARYYKAALRAWQRATPVAMILRSDNAVGARYRTLVRRLSEARRDSAPETLRVLGDALTAVGWLEEAVLVYGQAGAREARARVAGVRDFVRALRLEVRTHYRKLERGHATIDMSDLRDWIRTHWPTEQPPDLDRDLDNWFVIVEEANPFEVRKGSLAEALAPYNLVFDVGDNNGYLDLRMMKVLYRKRMVHQLGALPFPYTVLVTDETVIDNYLGYLSGHPRISGRAFLSRQGFYVAVDTIRPSKPSLRAFLQGPPESATSGEPGAYDRDLDAALRKRFFARMGLLHPHNNPSETQLDGAFAAYVHGYAHNVWLHELGHLVDFERFVPLSDNIGANLAVAVRCGLSPAKIELRFEQSAETFSLATTRYPYLSLQDNLDRLRLNPDSLFYMVLVAWQKRDPRDSPYYKGAKRILRAMLAGSGAERPADLAKQPPERIRALARKLCAEEGFPFDD